MNGLAQTTFTDTAGKDAFGGGETERGGGGGVEGLKVTLIGEFRMRGSVSSKYIYIYIYTYTHIEKADPWQ